MYGISKKEKKKKDELWEGLVWEELTFICLRVAVSIISLNRWKQTDFYSYRRDALNNSTLFFLYVERKGLVEWRRKNMIWLLSNLAQEK